MLNHHRTRTGARRRDEAFSIALTALLLVPLMLMAGLAVDLGSWYFEATTIQSAADAAALAGASAVPQGEALAIARAREVATQNGYTEGDDGGTIHVDVTVTGPRVKVVITDDESDQYFTSVVALSTRSIERASTAEYIAAVPMGSPRNFLGTETLMPAAYREGFWLSVSGHCARREFGDRITPIAMGAPTPPHTCNTASPGVLANPEYAAEGYYYGVEVPAGAGNTEIQMWDAPSCRAAPGDLTAQESFPTFDTEVTVRTNASLPSLGTVLMSRVFRGEDSPGNQCGATFRGGECPSVASTQLRDCWVTLATVAAGSTYWIQVDPVFRDADTHHNQFALRAKTGGAFIACSGDATIASPPFSATCPNVFGYEHLPVMVRLSGSGISNFYLASIDSKHDGKQMKVRLYDAAEGAQFIRVLDPQGVRATFDWRVLCADGRVPTPSCPGEADPTGGRGPFTGVQQIPVSGAGTKTFANNVQTGKYSDRILELTIQLPTDIAFTYGGATWWSIQYESASGTDRTTWSIELLGDPIRLVPNS